MGLLELLKKSEMRKLFGKRELAIIEKQLLGVSLTQSEKNRLSRDIRRKFDAIAALAPFIEEFMLKKGTEIRKLVNDARETILESLFYPKIRRVLLYGSSVENTRSLSSDIDFAVEFDEIDLQQATLFRKQILAKTPPRIDVQVYNLLPPKVKREIDSKGRTLYERKDRG